MHLGFGHLLTVLELDVQEERGVSALITHPRVCRTDSTQKLSPAQEGLARTKGKRWSNGLFLGGEKGVMGVPRGHTATQNQGHSQGTKENLTDLLAFPRPTQQDPDMDSG